MGVLGSAVVRPPVTSAQTTQTTTPLDICGILQAATQSGLTFTINGLNITYPLASTNSIQVPSGEVGKNVCFVGQMNAPSHIVSGTFSNNYNLAVVVCGNINSYVPAGASTAGFISIRPASIPVGINASFTGTAIAVGQNLCIDGQVNALGQLTVGTVSANTGGTAPLTLITACGAVSAYTTPGASTSGTITIATPTVTVTYPVVAAATINPSSFTGAGSPNVCLSGTLNAGGQFTQATFTANSTQASTLCGVVTAYTAATSNSTGTLTIGGLIVPLALSASFSGQPIVLQNSVCIQGSFNGLGQLVTGTTGPNSNAPTATPPPIYQPPTATSTPVPPPTNTPTATRVPTKPPDTPTRTPRPSKPVRPTATATRVPPRPTVPVAHPLIFSFTALRTLNAVGTPATAFKLGESIFLRATYSVQHAHGNPQVRVERIFEYAAGRSWKVEGRRVDETIAYNGTQSYVYSFVPNIGIGRERITLRLVLAGHARQRTVTITIRK